MTFEAPQRVADAVMYEGYVLYPYHASSDKNRVRFQFGVVAPKDFSQADGSESWEMQTECLVAGGAATRVDVRVRFLQLQSREVEAVAADGPGGFTPVASLSVAGEELVAWDEAVEQHVEALDLSLAELVEAERTIGIAIDGGRTTEDVDDENGQPAGRIIRTRWPIQGTVRIAAEPLGELTRLRVRIENLTTSTEAPAALSARDAALRRSLLGCHTLLAARNGAFLSLIDPPAGAEALAKTCRNLHTWPVLVGEAGSHDCVLSSPIILYDHPEIAPESQGDLFDSTEIDEILTLRIMTLTDEEKRAARATDPRARAIIDAADDMPPEIFDRLHGAIRYLRESPGNPAGSTESAEPADPAAAIHPWTPDEPAWPTIADSIADLGDLPPSVWEPEARVSPERAAIEVGGMAISKGAAVRLHPNRRADSMDMFLTGRTATVEAVFESVDEDVHVAVTIDDDPATDLHRAYGRFFYFAPDELEPISPAEPAAGSGPVILEPSARSLVER